MTATENIRRQSATELAIAAHLARKGRGLISPNALGRDKEKDFTILFPLKYEVKTDEKAGETGNLFFELKNSRLNEASGLMATGARIWIYYIPARRLLLQFEPSVMLNWISDIEPSPKYLTGVGDANSDGYLVPLEQVLQLPFVTKEENFDLL